MIFSARWFCAGTLPLAALLATASPASATEPAAAPERVAIVEAALEHRSPITAMLLPERLLVGGSVRMRFDDRAFTAEGNAHPRRHTPQSLAQFAAAGVQNQAAHDDVRLVTARTRLFAAYRFDRRATAYLELQHSRMWSSARRTIDNFDEVDLYQGWFEWRVAAVRDLTVKIGRFAVPRFGDGRILAPDDWSDTGVSLDGVQVGWSPGVYGLHVFVASAPDRDALSWSLRTDQRHTVAGAVVEVRAWDAFDVDGYLVARHFDRAFASEVATELDTGRRLDVTLGARVQWRPGPVRLTGEVYGQLGRQGPDAVSAWASAERIEWQMADLGFQPTFFFEHAYASGDKRRTDGVINTFDPLFPDTHGQLGPADQVRFQNVNSLATGFIVSLGGLSERLADWRFTFVARGSFLASQRDAWYAIDGKEAVVDPTGAISSSRTLEGELSGWIEGTLCDGMVGLSLGLAHWCPNNFLTDLKEHIHLYRVWFQTTVRF